MKGEYASPILNSDKGVNGLVFTYDSRALSNPITEGTYYYKFKMKKGLPSNLEFEYAEAIPWFKLQGTADQIRSSEKFSKILLEEYVKSTGAKNRGVIYRDDLTGTNWAEVTNTLIELGFMSNEEEDKKLSDEKYQEKIIDGLVNGIEKYLKSN